MPKRMNMTALAALLAFGTAGAGGAGGPGFATVQLPQGYSLYTSADGLTRFPYPAGWVAMRTAEQFIAATSLDALSTTEQEAFGDFTPVDRAEGLAVVNAQSLGLKAGRADPAAINAAFSKVLASPEAVKNMADLGYSTVATSPVSVGGKTFSGVRFDGKMTGFYMAYEYKPGILVTVVTIRKGPHDRATEQKLLWAASQLEYLGDVPALPK